MSSETGIYEYNFVSTNKNSWDAVEPPTPSTQELTLKIPGIHFGKGLSSKINPLIFRNSLELAPNISTLKIAQLKASEAALLRHVFELFKTHYPKNLTQVVLHTPFIDLFEANLKEELPQLYNDLVASLGHSQLTSLELDDRFIGTSPMTKEALSSLFTRSPSLKKVTFRSEYEFKDLSIPFHLLQRLEQVKIEKGHGLSRETFQSLKECTRLNSIIFENAWGTDKIRELLLQQHGLNLQRLEFKNTAVMSTDYDLFRISRQLPNLEVFGQNHFYTYQNQITDVGLRLLPMNCPRLTKFSFCFENITDEGFVEFVSKAPNLMILNTSQAYKLGEKSLIAIGEHCSELTTLELVHWKEITTKGLIAIAKGCSKLEQLYIHCCENVSIEGLERFIDGASQIKTIGIFSSGNTVEIDKLKLKHPQIKWHSHYGNSESPPSLPTRVTPSANITIPPVLLDRFLLEAVRHNIQEDIVWFISLGANPNMIREVDTKMLRPGYKETPLSVAALKGDLDTVKLLLKHGATKSSVEEILGGLSQKEHLPVLHHLLSIGCNPNKIGEYDSTPLQVMAAKKITGFRYLAGNGYSTVCVDCIKLLVAHGADTSVLHNEKLSLVDIARRCDNKIALDYFENELKLKALSSVGSTNDTPSF